MSACLQGGGVWDEMKRKRIGGDICKISHFCLDRFLLSPVLFPCFFLLFSVLFFSWPGFVVTVVVPVVVDVVDFIVVVSCGQKRIIQSSSSRVVHTLKPDFTPWSFLLQNISC